MFDWTVTIVGIICICVAGYGGYLIGKESKIQKSNEVGSE